MTSFFKKSKSIEDKSAGTRAQSSPQLLPGDNGVGGSRTRALSDAPPPAFPLPSRFPATRQGNGLEKLDDAAMKAPWFKSKSSISHSNSLRYEKDGSFFITPAPANSADFVLFYRHSSLVRSVDILDSAEGLHLTSCTRCFPCVSDLVVFYSSTQSPDLPCLLRGHVAEGSAQSGEVARVSPIGAPPVRVSASVGPSPRASPLSSGPFSSAPKSSSRRSSLQHEYAPIIPSLDASQSSSVNSLDAAPSRDFVQPLIDSLAASGALDSNYSAIEVDERTRRRLLSVSKGQQQLRADPHIDQSSLNKRWNAIGRAKDRALASLEGQPPGYFIIRGSDEYFGALSMVAPHPAGNYHAHIEKTERGLHLKKSPNFFACLSDLVAFYRKPYQTELPCALRLDDLDE